MSTLLQLRQKIGDRLSFRFNGSVTALGTKGLNGFVDWTVTEPDDALRNSWVLFTSGSLVGKVFQLAGARGGELTLQSPMPNQPAVNDTYDLYRRFKPATIMDAVNYGIRNAFPLIYARFEQEVAEVANQREYLYPSLASPTDLSLKPPGSGAQTWWYRIVNRDAAGDAVPGAAVSAVGPNPLTPAAPIVLTWTAVSNADYYLVLRATSANGPWSLLSALLASPVGLSQTFTDDGSYDAAAPAYTLSTVNPSLLELRQLWRRSNPASITGSPPLPPSYQEIPGSKWLDRGGKVMVGYIPSTGQQLYFVGYAANPELVNDSDPTYVPDEVVIAGGAAYLYENIFAGEAGSAADFLEKQRVKWAAYYEQMKRKYAMPAISLEMHPPLFQVRRGLSPDLGGPINPTTS